MKAFSLIEIVFALAIISLVLMVAVPKFHTTINNAHLSQIKSTIILIRQGIIQKSNELILQNNSTPLSSLDENSLELFSNILPNPIQSSLKQEPSAWSKVSSYDYKVYLDHNNFVTFTYDPTDQSFDCNQDNEYCKELSQ